MAIARDRLEEALSPVRARHVADLLETIARAIDAGAEVESEPWRRGEHGEVLRAGFFGLPSRHDVALRKGGRVSHPVVDTPVAPGATALMATAGDGFTLSITPFRWQAAELVVETGPRMPSWTPLRRWFLEHSQTGFGPEAPELASAVHSLGDPARRAAAVVMRVDFGSAPVSAVAALVEALAETGAGRAALRGG